MERAKYVVVNMPCGGMMMETPLVFPSFIQHRDIVSQMDILPCDVLSAGFVEFCSEGDIVVANAFGESLSLKVKSQPNDSQLITRALRLSAE